MKSEEERRWLREEGMLRVPTGRLIPLASLLEKLGYNHLVAYTHLALNLHEYQYHGPDPDVELSRYRSRAEATEDVKRLIRVIVRIVKEKVKPLLEKKNLWTKEYDEVIKELEERLSLGETSKG